MQEYLDKMGGDWGGYGEASLKQLIEEDKIWIAFAEKGVVVNVQNTQGQWGKYNLKHTDVEDF
jgi:hypothetical protein